jgi:hypothetical protein
MERGVRELRSRLGRTTLVLDPFSYLPGGTSPYMSEDSVLCADPGMGRDAETVFHTDYVWLGSGNRAFETTMIPVIREDRADVELEIRVHRYRTLASAEVECTAHAPMKISGEDPICCRIEVAAEDPYCYAMLARMKGGDCWFERIEVSCAPF